MRTGAENLIALIYREKTGCRQYPFYSIDELKKFCSRKPYANEVLRIMVFKNSRQVAGGRLPAVEVVTLVEDNLKLLDGVVL